MKTRIDADVLTSIIQIWRQLFEPFQGGEQPRAVTVVRDQRYGPAGRNLLDVYVPADNSQAGKPVLLFMHGGGFFSGDKRWSDKVRFESPRTAISK